MIPTSNVRVVTSNKIDDKLAQCGRAIDKLIELRAHEGRQWFEYHLCAYIGFVGAIKEYGKSSLRKRLKPDTPEKQWLEDLLADLDVATVINLRNRDVHIDALHVTNQRNTVELTGCAAAVVTGKLGVTNSNSGEVKETDEILPTAPSTPSALTPSKSEFLYLLDPKALKKFMIEHGKPSR